MLGGWPTYAGTAAAYRVEHENSFSNHIAKSELYMYTDLNKHTGKS